MTSINKRYYVVVWLIIIILIMMFLKIKYGYKNSETIIETKQITPTVSPVINLDDYPLQKSLPYVGKGFIIDQYTAPMTLQMTITTATKTVASKAVTEWINSFKDVKKQHTIIIKN